MFCKKSHSITYLTYLSVGSFLKYPYLMGKTPISMDSQYWGTLNIPGDSSNRETRRPPNRGFP